MLWNYEIIFFKGWIFLTGNLRTEGYQGMIKNLFNILNRYFDLFEYIEYIAA